HVLPVLVGTTVDFPNSDKVRHNVFTPSRLADRFNLGTYPTGVVKRVTFRRPGVIPLLCNVHAEMSAYIVVLETPYFAAIGPGGTFRISDVPGGRYELKTWHEALRPLTRAVEVPADGDVAVTFELSR
ncbi:MAG: hypothetical protein HYY85_10185, partial [Deltaproteobacteria bacterium]|nr:hypothetical protein [Deltaproteobacteria bacterium]